MMHSRNHHTLPPAVVIGLDSFTGLQTAHILARHDIPVVGISRDRTHPCSRTNACKRVLTCDTASEALVDLLVSLGAELQDMTSGQKSVLVPCSDSPVNVISRNRARLDSWYRIAMPSHDTMELLMDKLRFYGFATQHGFLVPQTFVLTCRSDALKAAHELRFPCILKPHRKNLTWEKCCSTKVLKLNDKREFLAAYDRFAACADVLLAQQWIEGPDSNLYSCNCYFNASNEPLVTFVARKLRQWPPDAGTSCLGEECRNDVVLEESLRLFRATRFRGLGYLEFKQDARDGRYFIIEPNVGRPTGRSAIAEAGGVALLHTMYCDMAGLPLPRNSQQQYRGVKWIYLRNDLLSAYRYWKRGRLSVRDWLRSWRGVRADALFSWRDPVPFILDFAELGTALLRRSGTALTRARLWHRGERG